MAGRAALARGSAVGEDGRPRLDVARGDVLVVEDQVVRVTDGRRAELRNGDARGAETELRRAGIVLEGVRERADLGADQQPGHQQARHPPGDEAQQVHAATVAPIFAGVK